ncbi:MAG: NYN domain-containing protein [Pseudomonadota bacterium]
MNSKVAIFVDGKNFYEGLRASGVPRSVDFAALARYVVSAVGGGVLTGLHYYTGLEPRAAEPVTDDEKQGGSLEGFLAYLETQPGCFVYRFSRRPRSVVCSECGHVHSYTEEKEVDTSLVATMIRQAAVQAFDAAVLCSGDADHTPALEALRDLGKPAWVATFSGHGLARRLRQAAYGHIDLTRALGERAIPAAVDDDDNLGNRIEDETRIDVVGAVREAEDYFGETRYVGFSMFVNGWRSDKLPRDPTERQRRVQLAIDEGLLEVYDAADGHKALRAARE